MAIRMGYWDCTSCGTKRIKGPERSCTACGKPRDPSIQFYTDDDAPEVTDTAELAHADSGADWQCPYCSADNRATQGQCIGCGAVRDGAKVRAEKLILDAPPPPAPSPRAPSHALRNLLLILGALSLGIYFLFIRTHALTVSVERVSWVKSLDLEQRVTTRESAWRDSVPGGARVVSETSKSRSKQIQDGTTKVKVGKKDLGNGFFKDVYEDRPRYVSRDYNDTWVTYDIDRWVQSRTLEERKDDGSEPPWPTAVERFDERVRGRKSRIEAALKGSDGKAYRFEIDPERRGKLGPAELKTGRTFTAEINAVGTVESLTP